MASKYLKINYVLLICGGVFFLMMPPAQAEEFQTCVQRANEASAEAMKQFKRAVHEGIAHKRPDLEPVSALSRDLELLYVEQRAARTAFLLASDPKRLDTTHGWGPFMNVKWTGEDEDALRAKDPAYAKLMEHVAALQIQSRDHPQRATLQTYLQKELSKNPEYEQAVATQITQGKALEAGLQTCGGADSKTSGNANAKEQH